MKRRGSYIVYILLCADNSYYTGYTSDLDKRLMQHQSGAGSKYTQYRLPTQLVFAKKYSYYENALKAEKRYKKMTRERKKKLISIYKNNPKRFME